MSEIIIGIDPGQSGGIAIIDSGKMIAFRMPLTERDTWDVLSYRREPHPRIAYLEKVGPMPKQGVSSTWKFGQHYGMLRAFLIAADIPFETVSPAKWQRAMGCLTKGDKNVSKRKAQELFPNATICTKTKKITHAVADAMLIAEYGRRLRNGEIAKNRPMARRTPNA